MENLLEQAIELLEGIKAKNAKITVIDINYGFRESEPGEEGYNPGVISYQKNGDFTIVLKGEDLL